MCVCWAQGTMGWVSSVNQKEGRSCEGETPLCSKKEEIKTLFYLNNCQKHMCATVASN